MHVLKKIYKKIARAVRYMRYRHLCTKSSPIAQYPYTTPDGVVVAHVSAFSYGNAGDAYLPIVLRNLFNDCIGVRKWIHRPVHKEVDSSDISTYNGTDLVVIGGGGLFLKDTHPNDVSGWQWNCSLEMLSRIEAPLVAFAIGYNRFRGQSDFNPIFTEHLNKFVDKAKFVGIRNHGSMEKLRKYLRSQELKEKLAFQPCMTTLTSLLYPGLCPYLQKEDFIALNCAFDRQQMRSCSDEKLKGIARVMCKLSQFANVKVYAHCDNDGEIRPYLDALAVKYEYIRFEEVGQMLAEYSKPRLVIGMRGHAQMIPFGCNTPILSIISHDKMQWFLNDIHHPEWGVDIQSPAFESELLAKARELYDSTDKLVPVLEEEQRHLWGVTRTNMDYIKSLVQKG